MCSLHCLLWVSQDCCTSKRSTTQPSGSSPRRRDFHAFKRWCSRTPITVARFCPWRWRIRWPSPPSKNRSCSPPTTSSIWVCGTRAFPISGRSSVSSRNDRFPCRDSWSFRGPVSCGWYCSRIRQHLHLGQSLRYSRIESDLNISMDSSFFVRQILDEQLLPRTVYFLYYLWDRFLINDCLHE